VGTVNAQLRICAHALRDLSTRQTVLCVRKSVKSLSIVWDTPQAHARKERLGPTKRTLSTLHILLLSARMLVYAIATLESVSVLMDILDLRASDVQPAPKKLTFIEITILAACPNDCNANGMCLTLSRLGALYGVDYEHPSAGGDGVGPVYVNWDRDSVTSCFCDPGFSGPDCSRSLFRSQFCFLSTFWIDDYT